MSNNSEFIRPILIQNLLNYKDKSIIKILYGVNRSGKTTLLTAYKSTLLSMGISPTNIIERNYSSSEYEEGFTALKMYADLLPSIEVANTSQKIYLLLDEVQEVKNFEKCISSLADNKNIDIYITGSCSKLITDEVLSYIANRFVLLPICTLTLREFIDFNKNDLIVNNSNYIEDNFDLYLKTGGFPFIARANLTQQENYQIIEGIYSTIVLKDIAKRHNIANLDMFNRVFFYILDNLGKSFSAKTIFDSFKAQHKAISIETVYNYLTWMEEAFLIYRCNRYDIQSKEVLKTQEKYYLSDISLKHSLQGYSSKTNAPLLENIIYLELKSRGYSVYLGKLMDKTIDFVAIKQNIKLYVQLLTNPEQISDNKIKSLKAIKDNYQKYVVTIDSTSSKNDEGIKIVVIKDFLLDNSY